ncbi:MAG TPA: GAF domain-containing protein [Polyangiaceae bacterium]
MFVVQRSFAASPSKSVVYAELNEQLAGLLAGERDGLANTANMAALLNEALPDLNWVGFYFLRGGELVLGPFQGKVACVRIALGRGVCGTAAAQRRTLIVPDVHAFPGHIACDAASRSELVLPLLKEGELLGVLDLDSPLPERFDQLDADGLTRALQLLLASSDMSTLIALEQRS